MFEQSHLLYYMFHVLGFITTFVFMYFYAKKFSLSPWRVIALFSIVYPLVYLFMYFQFWVESGFKNFGGNNIVRCFIWIPVFALPVAKLLKINYRKTMNLIAVIPCIIHCVSHIGCIFEGCCYGYPFEYGIWNPALHQYLFPIQIVESLVALAIIVFLVFYNKNNEYSDKAKAYPIMLMLFGSTRFFLEFLRDNHKLFWGISDLAIHAFVMFVVGLLLYIFYDKIFKIKPEQVNEPVPQKEQKEDADASPEQQ